MACTVLEMDLATLRTARRLLELPGMNIRIPVEESGQCFEELNAMIKRLESVRG